MMRTKFLPVAALLALGAACADDSTSGTPTNPGPRAFVRFVNAIPDTVAVDIRFIDQLEQPVPSIAFRTFTPYQPVTAGSRQIRVFVSPTPALPNGAVPLTARPDSLASIVLLNGTATLAEGQYYTIVLAGRTMAGQTPAAALQVYNDAAAEVTDTGRVAIRTIHAAAGVANVDVYVANEGQALYANPVVTLTNVPYLGASPYQTVVRRPAAPATSSYRWMVAPTGTTPTPAAVDFTASGNALVGVQGTTAVNPQAGLQVGRSVLTAIVFGPTFSARAGTGATAAALAAPTIRILPDRDPPRTAP